MKKLCMSLILITALLGCTLGLCACTNEDSSPLNGTWQFYGVVEHGDECIEDNIIKGDELKAVYGTDGKSNSNLIIDDNGIKGMFDNIDGTEVSNMEIISEKQFRQKITFTIVDGKKLKEPIVQDMQFTLNDGYLFVEASFANLESSPDNINVYKRDK